MAAAGASSPSAVPLRLVIVDNDQTVLNLLTLDLGLEGHQIMATAMEAESAVAACVEYEPDVLIVDLRLGSGPNGIDVAHRVRRPGLRIILHTNYVSTATVKAAAGAGAVVVEKGSLRALRRALYG